MLPVVRGGRRDRASISAPEDIEQMPEVVWYLPDDVSVEKVKSFIDKECLSAAQAHVWLVSQHLY